MAKIRTFIAIDPPEDIRILIERFQRELRRNGPGIRWEAPSKFHSTIKFLGDVEESLLSSIYPIVEFTARTHVKFHVTYEEFGVFPDRKHPKVLWIGCTDRDGSLRRFKRELDEALGPLGFEIEAKEFRPHVTLGRVKTPERIHDLLSLAENLNFEPRDADVDGILVMKSMLNLQGAEHSLLKKISLPTSPIADTHAQT